MKRIIMLLMFVLLGSLSLGSVYGALEDFTTYTEVDPNSRITKNASQVTYNLISQAEDAYVYQDYGVNYFDGDFTHSFDFQTTTGGSGGYFPMAYSLTNRLDDYFGTAWTFEDNIVGLVQARANGHIYLREKQTAFDCGTKSLNTDYYVKIVRIEAQNKLYAGIYSSDALRNAGNGTDADICNANVELSSSVDFRYVMVAQSYNNGQDSQTQSGYIRNLNLDASTPTPTPILQYNNITINDNNFVTHTYINSSNVTIKTFVLNESTNDFVNHSAIIRDENGTIIYNDTYATNTLNGTLSLTGLIDGQYYLNLTAFNNETSINDTGKHFHVDSTPGEITFNNNTEINTYTFNINESLNVTCSDSNLRYCAIYWDDGTITNSTTGTFNTNKTFSTNGNNTFVVDIWDLAGNHFNESGQLFINPINIIQFRNSITTDIIEDFYVNDILYSNNYTFKTYDLALGNHTLNFVKAGYINTSFNISLNLTNQINEIYNISPIFLFIKAFDADTYEQITFNLTLENSEILTYLNQDNLTIYYPITPLGDLKFVFSSEGYSNGIFYNTLSEYSSLSFNVYLTPENDSQLITFNIVDFNTGGGLGEALIEAQMIINETYVTLQQTKTSDNGDAFLYLDTEKDYKFVFSLDGYTEAVIDSIPSITTYTIRLRSEETTFNYINNVNFRFFPQSSTLYQNETYNLTAFLSGTAITQSRFIITLDNGTRIYDQTNTNPTGTTYNYEYFIPDGNISKINYNLTYIRDGISFIRLSQYSVFGLSDGEIKEFIDAGKSSDEEFKLWRLFIICITLLGVIILGMKSRTTENHISIIVIVPILFFIFIEWIPLLYGSLLILVAMIFYIGGNKK